MTDGFWEDPERVERFAERDPDHRLAALVDEYPDPGSVRALDVGCAGGRNAAFLAERGFQVWALDAAAAMVDHTRGRLEAILGAGEAEGRVVRGRMDDLGHWPDGYFDLVVTVGVLHSASTWAEWERAAAEVARVLKPGGRLLLSQFTPDVDLTGDGVTAVPGEPHVYDGFPAGRAVFLEAEEQDLEWARLGLEPVVPSEVVRVDLENGGRRVSVNGQYRKS